MPGRDHDLVRLPVRRQTGTTRPGRDHDLVRTTRPGRDHDLVRTTRPGRDHDVARTTRPGRVNDVARTTRRRPAPGPLDSPAPRRNTSKISRRGFLGRCAAAAAGVMIVPRHVLGGPGEKSPGERITVGFIGVGGMGGGHLGGFLGDKQVWVRAVCDVDRGKREGAKRKVEGRYGEEKRSGKYKGCEAYSDFREILVREDIDAVLIATPDHWHAIPVIQAAQAGKDIYSEKPLSLTIREARAMVEAVRRYGRVHQTGSQQRSSGRFRRACELVRSGKIGELKTVHVALTPKRSGGRAPKACDLPAQPVPDGLDWEMWLGPAPWRPYNRVLHPQTWRLFREFSGGDMTDWGAHHFDIAQWGIGASRTGPVEIIPPDGRDHEYLTYRYANGVVLHQMPRQENGITFIGTEGEVFVNRGALRTKPESVATATIGPNDVHLFRSPGHRANWLECIRTRERPICDVEIGCRSVTVCHLGNIAYWLNRPIRWDPETEEIIDDEQASRWLDRPKRAPWRL